MILDQFNLAGKTAVVTGSATGLGRAAAIGLADAGADIAGIYHTRPPEKVMNAVQKTGRKFTGIQADLFQPDSIQGIVDKVMDVYGHIDILVNNAGIIRRSPVLEFSEKDWNEVIQVNQNALFFLSQAVVKTMVERKKRGKIINIASMLSFQGGIKVAAYTASKHAVMGITRIMANELALQGININAIAPGYMETENTRPLREDPKRNKAILERIPQGRWGKPEDLQGAVVFLASPASDYINGYTLAVDGGWLAR
jgi:2-deoxy-D-gluconate 3-dehydrogenase